MENPSSGRRDGQIRQNGKHMFDFRTGKFINPTKRLQDIMTDKGFLRRLRKAMEILGEWQ